MRSFSVYIIVGILTAVALGWVGKFMDSKEVEAFYGFAETNESEINFNYPVEIKDILVRPGDLVEKGDPLLIVKRETRDEVLADQDFRIDELKAESNFNEEKIKADIDDLDADFQTEMSELRSMKTRISSEARYREELLKVVLEESSSSETYSPIKEELKAINTQINELESAYKLRRSSLKRQLNLASKPLIIEMDRLRAEAEFDAKQAELIYTIAAPSKGVIGNINAKISEHKSSFSPLINFYEPRPSQVKGYIHEDRILQAQVGDSIQITSLTSPETNQVGVITGLGSRIIEIPSRLRRMADIRTYGREVLIKIPESNPFLQKEKVELTFLTSKQ